MQVLSDLRLADSPRPVVLAAGFFDGVHIGHRAVIARTVSAAAACGGSAWAFTFDSHPLEVISPGAAPKLLTGRSHKMRLLERLGLDGCFMLTFSPDMAAIEPGEFVSRLLDGIPNLAGIVVGENWRFARNASGNVAMLSEFGQSRGFEVVALPPVLWKGGPVSSTRIRAALSAGDLESAGAMLGRPPSALGMVGRGRSIGARMGFPTANIEYENEALPPIGVYAAMALIEGSDQPLKGVANLGMRPTFGEHQGTQASLEIHVLDFAGDLYGKQVEVFFIRRIREEIRFASEEDLQKTVREDSETARRMLDPAPSVA